MYCRILSSRDEIPEENWKILVEAPGREVGRNLMTRKEKCGDYSRVDMVLPVNGQALEGAKPAPLPIMICCLINKTQIVVLKQL